MGELYHGSNIKGLKVLHTHQSTHGKYVYATPHKGLALLFSGIAGDDLTYTIFRNGKKEPWNIVERVPIAFKTMFSNNASLYTVSDEKFEDIYTGICELVSKEDVENITSKLIKKEEYLALFQEVNEKQTEESKFVDQLTKIESDVQAKIYNLEGRFDIDVALEYAKYY